MKQQARQRAGYCIALKEHASFVSFGCVAYLEREEL